MRTEKIRPLLDAMLVCMLPAAVSGACGKSDDVSSGPVSVVQRKLTEQQFLAAIDGDAETMGCLQALQSAGFDRFVTAGMLQEDSGASLEFGAYVNGLDALRAVVRHCNGPVDCVAAVALVEQGAVTWLDKAGERVPPRTIALPELAIESEDTPGHSSCPHAAEPDLGARRLVVADRFGDAFGITAGEIAAPLSSSGAFTDVEEKDYVGGDELLCLLAGTYPHEALVLLSQSVRALVAESKAGQVFRTVGLAGNQGLYGWEAVGADALVDSLAGAAFGGPGLLLVIGSHFMDGTGDPASVAGALQAYHGCLAGFQGSAAPSVLLAAARVFLEAMGEGLDAGEARDRANAALAEWGEDARMVLAGEQGLSFRLLPPHEGFWHQATPKSALFNPLLHLRPYCSGPSGEEALPEEEANPAMQDVVFDGPRFHGTREIEIAPGEMLHAEVSGTLGAIEVGARFFFTLSGDLKEDFRGMKIHADAVITSLERRDNDLVVKFDGTARVDPYVGMGGRSCVSKDTLLGPLVGGTGRSSSLTVRF